MGVFTWVHPVHGELSSNENFTVMTEEYQGGATTTLVINHAKPEDKGTYTLQAENRNGKEKVDLDLTVLDHLPDCECNLYKGVDKDCICQHSYTGKDPCGCTYCIFGLFQWRSIITSPDE